MKTLLSEQATLQILFIHKLAMLGQDLRDLGLLSKSTTDCLYHPEQVYVPWFSIF